MVGCILDRTPRCALSLALVALAHGQRFDAYMDPVARKAPPVSHLNAALPDLKLSDRRDGQIEPEATTTSLALANDVRMPGSFGIGRRISDGRLVPADIPSRNAGTELRYVDRKTVAEMKNRKPSVIWRRIRMAGSLAGTSSDRNKTVMVSAMTALPEVQVDWPVPEPLQFSMLRSPPPSPRPSVGPAMESATDASSEGVEWGVQQHEAISETATMGYATALPVSPLTTTQPEDWPHNPSPSMVSRSPLNPCGSTGGVAQCAAQPPAEGPWWAGERRVLSWHLTSFTARASTLQPLETKHEALMSGDDEWRMRPRVGGDPQTPPPINPNELAVVAVPDGVLDRPSAPRPTGGLGVGELGAVVHAEYE